MNKLALASILTAAAMFAQSTPASTPTDTAKPATTTTKVKKHHKHKKDAVPASTTSSSTATDKPAPKK